MNPIKKYLATTHRAERLQSLKNYIKQGISIPIDLTEDLLLLDIASEEKSLLVEGTRCDDYDQLEDFYLRGVSQWPQDVAVVAVRQWCSRTPQKKYRQWVDIIRKGNVPQRLFYTVIDRAFSTGGSLVIKEALESEGLFEMSHAVHGLLILRSIQWNIQSKTLTQLALKALSDHDHYFVSEHRATIPALMYLLKTEPDILTEITHSQKCNEVYKQLIISLKVAWQHERMRLTGRDELNLWPALWHRSDLKVQDIHAYLQKQAKLLLPNATVKESATNAPMASKNSDAHLDNNSWEEFAGIPASALLNSLLMLGDHHTFVTALNMIGGLINEDDRPKIIHALEEKNIFADPFLSLLVVGRYHPQTKAAPSNPSHGGSSSKPHVQGNSHLMRREFFDVAFRGATQPTEASPTDNDEEHFWKTLTKMWINPQESQLNPLAQMIRKRGGLAVLCYLNALGRCRGMDQAALKVLDYIRSDQEDEMRAVISALSGINTPRSLQELIAAITRPNMTRTLQLEALTYLKQHDLSHVQPHLRSAFADLGKPTDAPGIEVRELLATLLTSSPKTLDPSLSTPMSMPSVAPEVIAWDQTFDQKLSSMIQGYKELSSEVKRALRTSLFFHMQVEQKGTSGLIDLSPIVDMQYKALELLFRESFEDYCSKLINRGILQRKLDIIGYARPIPHAMDQFENYICSLPVVREIPFFSKFKLRKMLRAICQFRPGRRFTLDGLKAFALFFLCFGRKECQYGLQQLLELGFENDKNLFDFAYSLHIFQDLRNRAAHEGLHPEASSDIDKLWLQTSEIIQKHHKVYYHIASATGLALQRTQDAAVVKPSVKEPKIIKKVS